MEKPSTLAEDAASSATMRAVIQDRYGPAEAVLRVGNVDRPHPRAREVLVRVRAASMHADVWHVVTGWPYALRLMGAGVLRPNHPIPGTDLAGVVAATGEEVTRFSPGDAVFGETLTKHQWTNGGAFAEYAAVPEDVLARKPEGVSFEEAAAVPSSGLIALQNLRMGGLRKGQRVLINGAGGGVGSIAVQIAKAYGAHVTGVDHTKKLEMLRSLGADEAVDYTQVDVTRRGERFDLILDVASTLSLRSCKPILSQDGVYVFIGHDHYGTATGRLFGSVPRALGSMLVSPFVRGLPKPTFSGPNKREIMEALARLLETGKLTPVVERVFPLEAVPDALRYLQEGRPKGKIIIAP